MQGPIFDPEKHGAGYSPTVPLAAPALSCCSTCSASAAAAGFCRVDPGLGSGGNRVIRSGVGASVVPVAAAMVLVVLGGQVGHSVEVERWRHDLSFRATCAFT